MSWFLGHALKTHPVSRPSLRSQDLYLIWQLLTLVVAVLYHDAAFEAAHRSVELQGDTPSAADRVGGHFIAYVKAEGRLWELEGSRKGPLDRGALAEDEDVLSPRALELGIKRIVKLDQEDGGNNLLFSCTALAKKA
jgi:ubiquitin carboxyl-terminal hydrolase L3